MPPSIDSHQTRVDRSIGDIVCCAALVMAVVVGWILLLPIFAAAVP